MDDYFRRRRRRRDEQINLVNDNDPSVTEIRFEGHETEDQIRALFRGLERNTHVQKLDLYSTPFELRRTLCQQLLPPLFEENSSIQNLRFRFDMTNAEFLRSVDALCNSNNNATVKTLTLAGCDIHGGDGGVMIGRLIRNNHHITTINLQWNKRLGSAGATRIAAALVNDDCALKTLNLGWCGIGDEGVDALCTALQVNTSLETFRFDGNKFPDEGYRALARTLPEISGIKEIRFGWEERQVSAAVLQEMMDGLRKNQSLHRIYTLRNRNLSEEQCQEWNTCCTFVGARNKMNSHLDKVRDRMDVAAREGIVRLTPVQLGHLLQWCHRQEDAEVQDSLRFLVLCSNADEILGLADDMVAEENGQEEKAIADATAARTEETEDGQKEKAVADATTMRAGTLHKWICLLCCRRGREREILKLKRTS